MVKELKSKGEHQSGIVLVEDSAINFLLASGKYETINESPKEDVKVVFKKSWMEDKIKEEIAKHKIPVKYNISNDDKVDILKKLERLGYEVKW